MGEKFSKCFADKIDQMQTRLPAVKVFVLHVEASRAASPQHSHHPGTVRTSGRPMRSLSESKACPASLPQKPVMMSPKSTNWVIKEDECPANVLLRKCSCRHKRKGSQHSGMAQAKNAAVFWVLAHSHSTMFTSMVSSGPRGPGHRFSLNTVLGDKAQALCSPHSHMRSAILLVKVQT